MEVESKAIQHTDEMPVTALTEQADRAVLNEKAKRADEEDHKAKIIPALRLHYKAVFWAFVVSMCVIMEGYDTNLLGNFYAYRSLPSPSIYTLLTDDL